MRQVIGKTILILVAVALLAILALGGFVLYAIHSHETYLSGANTPALSGANTPAPDPTRVVVALDPKKVVATSVDASRSRVFLLYEDSHVASVDVRTGATLMTSEPFITGLTAGDQAAMAVDDRANRVMFAFGDVNLRVVVIDSDSLTLIRKTDDILTNGGYSPSIAIDERTGSALVGAVGGEKVFFSTIRTGRQDGTLRLVCSLTDMTFDPHRDRAFVLDDPSSCTSQASGATVVYLRAIDLRTRAFIGRKAVPSTVTSLAMDTKDDLLTLVSERSLQVLRPGDLRTEHIIKMSRPASLGQGDEATTPLGDASHFFQENGDTGTPSNVVMVDLRRGIVEKSMPLTMDASAADESVHHLLTVFNPDAGTTNGASSTREIFRLTDLRTGRLVKQQTVDTSNGWSTIQDIAVDVPAHRFFVAKYSDGIYILDSRTGRIIAPRAS